MVDHSYGMDIVRGYVEDFLPVHKFGSNTNLSGSQESIWSVGGMYPWSAFATAQTLYFISTDNADTNVLEVEGLDANYNLQTKEYTLTGTTAIDSGSDTWARVFRMYTEQEHAGTITARVTSGVGTVVAQIDASFAQTRMAVYTIPAGYNGYLLQYTAGVGKGNDVNLLLFVRPFNCGFRVQNQSHLYQNTFTHSFALPLFMHEKSDIDFTGTTQTPGSDCLVSFDLILDKK